MYLNLFYCILLIYYITGLLSYLAIAKLKTKKFTPIISIINYNSDYYDYTDHNDYNELLLPD